ncbi:hypothetical protein [Paraburkholderia sp. MM6662-R1]|uniref:hypothetical protein n=1 Tax=Paraburkholderia sp. MM6662-R1 TaxID=2991066 RepID=UPI003D1D6BEA
MNDEVFLTRHTYLFRRRIIRVEQNATRAIDDQDGSKRSRGCHAIEKNLPPYRQRQGHDARLPQPLDERLQRQLIQCKISLDVPLCNQGDIAKVDSSNSPFAKREVNFAALNSADTTVLRLLTHCSKERTLGKGGFVLATSGSAGQIGPADNTLTPLPCAAVSNRGIE